MSETNNIPNTFQNLQVLEEARTAARLNLKSEYESVVKPFVSIIEILLGHTTATLNQFTFGIDQQPTISASDIVVAKI